MFVKPNEHTKFKTPTFTGTFYFTVANADELWNELKDKARVCYPLEIFEWGMKEFSIFDNIGYMLQFGEEILF